MRFLTSSKMKDEKLLSFLLLYAFCLVYHGAQGSVISFVSSPDVIKDGLTDSLILRCSLNDTAASSAIIGKRDVTQIAENVAEVTTIVVMRNGKDIASISGSSPAQIMDGSVNVKISGSVAGSSGERGFIELTFQNPLKSQLGEFACEINAVRKFHMVTFSSSLEVTAVTPTTADLIQSIQDMKYIIAEHETHIAELKKKCDTEIFFSVGLSVDRNVGNDRVVVYDKVYANVGSGYDPTTGQFTCNTPGFYHFEMSAITGTSSAARLRLFQNDKKDFSIYVPNNYNGASNSGILKLSKGDIVKVVSEISPYSNLHSYAGGIFTTFNGQLVSLT